LTTHALAPRAIGSASPRTEAPELGAPDLDAPHLTPRSAAERARSAVVGPAVPGESAAPGEPIEFVPFARVAPREWSPEPILQGVG
jgi:hypothetical protein